MESDNRPKVIPNSPLTVQLVMCMRAHQICHLHPYCQAMLTQPLWYRHDMRIRDKFLKIHMTCVSDTRVRRILDTTWLHDRRVRAT